METNTSTGLDAQYKYVLLNTIGLAVLADALRSASYFFTMSNNKQYRNSKTISDSVTFIQGTGLEILLNYYHIAYEAETLRKNFFSFFHQPGFIK